MVIVITSVTSIRQIRIYSLRQLGANEIKAHRMVVKPRNEQPSVESPGQLRPEPGDVAPDLGVVVWTVSGGFISRSPLSD